MSLYYMNMRLYHNEKQLFFAFIVSQDYLGGFITIAWIYLVSYSYVLQHGANRVQNCKHKFFKCISIWIYAECGSGTSTPKQTKNQRNNYYLYIQYTYNMEHFPMDIETNL